MPRAKRGFKRRRRTNKVLKKAKGFFQGRRRLVVQAMEAVDKSLTHAYRGRRLKKRDMRALWQIRISAAAKEQGTSFSRLIGNLKKKGCVLNRKVLAEMAIDHPKDFAEVVKWCSA